MPKTKENCNSTTTSRPTSTRYRIADIYMAPVDAHTILVPQKHYGVQAKVPVDTTAPTHKIKSVYYEDGMRKIPRELTGTPSEIEAKKRTIELKRKAEENDREDSYEAGQIKCLSLSSFIEDSDDLNGSRPAPQLPGPYDPERARYLYSVACKNLNVLPSSRYRNGLKSGRVIAGHQGFGPLGAKAVSMSLFGNRTVTELIIPRNNLGAEGMRSLARLISQNEVIKVLDISDNELGRDGAKVLAAAIKENGSIQQINAAGNKFDDETGEDLGDAFAFNTAINQVDFSRNRFCELGAAKLAKGFEYNCSVTHLDLRYNHIRRKGITGIATMLANNHYLMQLDLSWNGIDLDGAMRIGKALRKNDTLTVLNISGCRITIRSLLTLVKRIKKNIWLKALAIADNPLTSADMMTFLKAIEALPGLALNFIDASSIMASEALLDMQNSIAETRPGFLIKYRGRLSVRDISKNPMDSMDMTDGDPFGLILEYARQKNLKIMDIFAVFDMDNSGALSRQEIIMGVAHTGIPLNIQQLDRVVARLDKDGDGEIDLKELTTTYCEFMRDMVKRGKMTYSAFLREIEINCGVEQREKEESGGEVLQPIPVPFEKKVKKKPQVTRMSLDKDDLKEYFASKEKDKASNRQSVVEKKIQRKSKVDHSSSQSHSVSSA